MDDLGLVRTLRQARRCGTSTSRGRGNTQEHDPEDCSRSNTESLLGGCLVDEKPFKKGRAHLVVLVRGLKAREKSVRHSQDRITPRCATNRRALRTPGRERQGRVVVAPRPGSGFSDLPSPRSGRAERRAQAGSPALVTVGFPWSGNSALPCGRGRHRGRDGDGYGRPAVCDLAIGTHDRAGVITSRNPLPTDVLAKLNVSMRPVASRTGPSA